MPSVFHEPSNSSKLNIFCRPEWNTRGLYENESELSLCKKANKTF